MGNAYKDRTDQKIEFARIYLDLRLASSGRGDNTERAHEESFLFHLVGATDAFKKEIKHAYKLNGSAENHRRSKAWLALQSIENDDTHWLHLAKYFRNHGAHGSNIGHNFYVGGEKNGTAEFTNPFTKQPMGKSIPDYLKECLNLTTSLIADLRSQLPCPA